MAFIPWTHKLFNISKSINFIYYFKLKKGRKHHNPLWMLPHRRSIWQDAVYIHGKNSFKKVDIDGTYIKIIEAVYDKPTVSIIFNIEKLKPFTIHCSSKFRKKARMPFLTNSISHSIEGLSHSSQTTKTNKHPYWKERSKIVIICRWYDSLYGKVSLQNYKN